MAKKTTEGQRRNAESAKMRLRCIREIEAERARGNPVSIPFYAERFERTTQCIYKWLEWGKKQGEKT